MKDAIRLAEHFLKQRMTFLLILDAGNQHNCNEICEMLFLFIEFTTKFKSMWVIKLKQLFAEGKGEIGE